MAARAHGHGFAARTSVNRAGKVACTAARAIVTSPDSSGWRSASSESRPNSGASSRNKIPMCARLTAPGRITPAPPPTIAAFDDVWCGAQNGGTVQQPRPRRQLPATEWIDVTSIAAAVSSIGRIVGSRSASIVLPAPGGPSSDR